MGFCDDIKETTDFLLSKVEELSAYVNSALEAN